MCDFVSKNIPISNVFQAVHRTQRTAFKNDMGHEKSLKSKECTRNLQHIKLKKVWKCWLKFRVHILLTFSLFLPVPETQKTHKVFHMPMDTFLVHTALSYTNILKNRSEIFTNVQSQNRNASFAANIFQEWTVKIIHGLIFKKHYKVTSQPTSPQITWHFITIHCFGAESSKSN